MLGWRPEGDLRYLPMLLSSLHFEIGLSLNLGLADVARLAGCMELYAQLVGATGR